MDLPDIRGKVRISTADVDVAEAKVKAFTRSVKDSVDGMNVEQKMNAAGQAFIKFGASGEVASVRISSATAKSRTDLDNLEARARKFAEGLDQSFRKGGQAVVKLGEDGAVAMSRFAVATEETAQAVDTSIPLFTGLGAALAKSVPLLGAIGTTGMAVVIPVLIGIALALSPVIVLLGSFTVGLTAALTVIGLATGGVLALGAGVVLLAQRFASANPQLQIVQAAQQQLTQATQAHQLAVSQLETLQNSLKGHKATADQLQLEADLQKQVTKTSYDLVAAQNAVAAAGTATEPPLQRLTDRLGQMADTLGRQASPAAAQIAGLLVQMVDPIQKVGSSILTWFGEVLPQVLGIAQGGMGPFFDTVGRLGEVFRGFFDQVLMRAPALGAILQGTANAGVGALAGLLDNLLRLTDWFTDRLPTAGPIVASIMGRIGGILMGVAQAAGAVADFFIANWPRISGAASATWAVLQQGWNAIAPVLRVALPAAVAAVSVLFGFMAQHSELVRGVLLLVGAAAAVVVGALVLIGVVVVAAVALLAGVAALLVKAWGPIQPYFLQLWANVTAVFNQAVAVIGAQIHDWLSGLQGWWKEHGAQVMQVVEFLWTFVRAAFTVGGTLVVAILRVAFGLLWDIVKVTVTLIIDGIRMAWDILSGIFTIFLDLITGNWGKAWDDLKKTVSNVMSDIGRILHDFVGGVWNIGRDLVMNIVEGIKSVAGALGGALHAVLVDAVGGPDSPTAKALAAAHVPGFAAGGVAMPGTLFTVGEAGPELGYALPGGGVAIVPGGGTTHNYNLTLNGSGAVNDPEGVRRMLLRMQRLGATT